MKVRFFIPLFMLVALLAGCAANTQQAPVIERTPVVKKGDTGKTVTRRAVPPAAGEKDWRPDNYIVKKGDTLYGVGLEFGFDYKEIAQHNNIQPPYVIRVGQPLKLPKGSDSSTTPATPSIPATEAVAVATPLKTEPSATVKPISEPPTFSEPKAIKEPYSEQAMAAAKAADISPKVSIEKPAVAEKAAEGVAVKVAEVVKAEAPKPLPKTEAKTEPVVEKTTPATADDESLEWTWPVSGKTLTGFSDSASAKGIDISGTAGQPVHAAGPGKVVYSGSGLRGYGKLVIIKHNKTFLSAYAHNSQILVKEGQEVTKGQKIAEMGNTDTDRVKLHFEIRRLGKPVDPTKYLPASG